MFCGAELHINSSTLEIVRVPSSSPAATTFPLPIHHTTTTISREALRHPNLIINYLAPPRILSSRPSSSKHVNKQSAKGRIMHNHSCPKCTTSQPPLRPTVVQHLPAILADVSSPNTKAAPTMLNLDNNYSCLDEAYIEPAGLITTGHWAKWRKKMLQYARGDPSE
jgi:hypothetical protein